MVGDLAESYIVKDKKIIFNLRKNVLWHDGVEFTSKDVVFTFKKLVDPNIPSPYSSNYKLVKEVKAVGKYKVVVTYTKPFAPALESWMIGIIPEHVFKKGDFVKNPANRAPIGTGPFKFKLWKTDERIVLEKNTFYFGIVPKIDRFVYRIVPDQSIQFLETRQEAVDVVYLRPDQFIGFEEFFKKYKKFRYPANSYTYLGFNLNHPLLKIKKFRKAIAHAINKNEIIDGVLLGFGIPATGPLTPLQPGYNSKITDFEFDIKKANEILDELGLKDIDGDGIRNFNGKNIELVLITNHGNKIRELTAQIIEQNLKKIGIRLSLRFIEWSSFINNYINKRNFDMVILGWALSFDPDQYLIWHSNETGPGKYNFVGYKNPVVDRLLKEGRTTFDIKKRKRIYSLIHRIIHDDIPYVFLFYPEALVTIHGRFKGVKQTKLGVTWNMEEWYTPPMLVKYK